MLSAYSAGQADGEYYRMDAPPKFQQMSQKKRLVCYYTRLLRALLNEYRIPPQKSSYTSTYLPSHKTPKFVEKDMRGTAGTLGTNS